VDPFGQIGVILSTKAKDRPLVKALVAANNSSTGTSSSGSSNTSSAGTGKSKSSFMSRLTGSSSSSSSSGGGTSGSASGIAGSSDVHLLLHTDAVSEGMLLAKVEADRGGFTEEIDTSRMTATEARTALRPLQVSSFKRLHNGCTTVACNNFFCALLRTVMFSACVAMQVCSHALLRC
jgi:hypothetical protein